MNGASILLKFCSLGFKITWHLEENDIDLCEKPKHDYLELIIPF